MTEIVELTAEIVSAFVNSNKMSAAELPQLIQSVHKSLMGLGEPEAPAVEQVQKPTPAQIRKSITDVGLVSFEDGKTYQSLKRNLATRGMTPDDYRSKWGLPHDYPMVSPAYAAKRSQLAMEMGLGRKPISMMVGPSVSTPAPLDDSDASAPKLTKGKANPKPSKVKKATTD